MAEDDAARPVPVSIAPDANAKAAKENVAADTPRDSAPRPVVSKANVEAVAQVRASEPRQHVAARGEEAVVLRGRQAWLRGLAHKYGFRQW
jgi:hypothetical protein